MMKHFSSCFILIFHFFPYLCRPKIHSQIFNVPHLLMKNEIIIREARKEDAAFVARCVCMALHHELSDDELPRVAAICSREDVLYSYQRAIIAWLDEEPVGLCLAYDGEGYHETRVRTFALFAEGQEEDNGMDLEHAEDETGPGEYYIDSLAVLPSYRRRGIARLLMKAQIKRGLEKGLAHITLLVDPENPDAQGLYRQLGFEYHSDCYAFGQIYWKWELKK